MFFLCDVRKVVTVVDEAPNLSGYRTRSSISA